MFLNSWLPFRRRHSQGVQPKRHRRRQRTGCRLGTRMRVEHLEDRCVPASGLSASLVADLVPRPGSSNPQNLANMNGTLYFATSNPTTGTEMWKSDGTAAGTVLLAPGFNSSNPQVPQDFTWFNNAVYFEANYELWKSDGTPNGTVIVDKQVSPNDLTVAGG